MSLGNYIYSIFSGQETQEAKNGIDMAPTPYLSYALTATGFGNNSVLNLGALTLGTVKIVFGYTSYYYSTTTGTTYTASEQLSNQASFDYQTEALVQARLGGVPENTDIVISTDGVIVPTPGGQNTGNSEPALLEAVQPELPAAEQSIVLYDAVDVNNSTGNNEVTLMALTTEQPDPIEPNLVEPIPPGEYEAITDSEFTNNITAGETNVIAYDEKTDSYLVVPESETVLTDNTTAKYSTSLQLPFFYATQANVYMTRSSTSNPLTIEVTSSNSGVYFDTITVTYSNVSVSPASAAFLIIGA